MMYCGYLPDSHEFYIHMDTIRFFELAGEMHRIFIIMGIHMIRERELLLIAWWK